MTVKTREGQGWKVAEPLNATVAGAIQNAVQDRDRAAIYYLQNYEDRRRTWVTPDAYEKINEALEKFS